MHEFFAHSYNLWKKVIVTLKGLFTRAVYDQQFCIGVKHDVMGILRTDTFSVRPTCGVELKYKKGVQGWMQMLGLNETMDQLAMASSGCWYDDVLRRKGGHVLRRALDF